MYRSPQGHSCRIVVLEGADRLGKSTQAKLLETALERDGVRGILEKAPYKDGVAYERIYEMLENGDAVRHPVVFQSFQGMNRRFFQHRYLPTLAGHFDVVLLDRWTLSTRVYGTEAGVPEEATECILDGIIDPDLIFVLDGHPFRIPDAGDTYEADAGFQARVRDRYRSWALAHPETTELINANRGIESVHDEIVATFKRRVVR